MSRAKIVTDGEGRFFGIRIICPACTEAKRGSWHVLDTEWMPEGMERAPRAPTARTDRWSFNGDLDRPVFGPSLLIQGQYADPPVTSENHAEWKANPWPQKKVSHVCHSFIGCNGAQPGQIIYLSDCTHALAGKTVDLPEIGE